VGTFVGSTFLPLLADMFGRKPIFIVGLILHLVSVVGLMLGTNYYLLLALMFVNGMAEVGRYYVAYVYSVEAFPKRHNNIAGMVIFCCMSTTKVCICFFFMFGSKQLRNWHYLGYFSIGYVIFSLIMTIWYLRESSRFLFDKGKAQESV